MKPFFTEEEFIEAYLLFIERHKGIFVERATHLSDARALYRRIADRASAWHVIMQAWGDHYLDADGDAL